ncbi:unnamed protein product, partial [marine sediment metagenome]
MSEKKLEEIKKIECIPENISEKKQNNMSENVKPNGLPNKGNTCYINTAIQTISQIFGDYFVSGEYYKKLSNDPKKIDFMNNFAYLIAAIENNNGRWSRDHIKLHLKESNKYLSTLDN